LDGHVVEAGGAARAAATRIAVVKLEGAWRLVLNGERVGRFARRRDAMDCALDVARETRQGGSEVELLAEDRSGELAPAVDLSFNPRRPAGRTAA
jgi:hypothetical protein